MVAITRHALRVYASLSALKGNGEDVLDALIPFFDPILLVMDNRLFDPRLLASGVRKLYHWKFTKEVAEQFIPRLERRGYLEKRGIGRDAAYRVTFPKQQKLENPQEFEMVFEDLISKFEAFPPLVTDLLHYSRTREELADILIRFLVTSNSFIVQNGSADILDSDESATLAKIEEGGRPLASDDKYMAARFVSHIADNHPDHLKHLAYISSIGMLTEVVDDFVRPTTSETKSDLSILLDAPIALDYLGLSGLDIQRDVKGVLDELKRIGCKLLVFPVTCREITRNLQAFLNLDPSRRFGPTYTAVNKREVLMDFVRKVSAAPEEALEAVGVEIKPIELESFPHAHKFFDSDTYDDFYSSINWVVEIEPKEHDATCTALIMRLREGRSSSDIFRNRYVLATRNPTFAKTSRKYCIQSRKIGENHEGPVVHQRELATVAWLRTGLGSADNIPRAHLVATCEKLLRVRPEVADAIRAHLAAFRPELAQQFELLVLDQKSLRKLGDSTLNDASVITDDNALQLLEVMKAASIEDAKKELDATLSTEVEKHDLATRKLREKHKRELEEAQNEQAKLKRELQLATEETAQHKAKEEKIISQLMRDTNRTNRRTQTVVTFVLLSLVLVGLADVVFGEKLVEQLPGQARDVVKYTSRGLGVLGLYYLLADMLQAPKWGMVTILNHLSKRRLKKTIVARGLTWTNESDFSVQNGNVSRASHMITSGTLDGKEPAAF